MKKSPTTFDIILSDAQIQFQNALSYARGKKILVVDEKVSGIISRVADASILKEHAIENIFYLTHQAILADARTLVYVCRPELSSMLNII
ncbi:Vacuolar protein-sorting-associated protein 33, partial [Coelomomyces lativittatus]